MMESFVFSKFNFYQKSDFSNSVLIYQSLHRKIARLSVQDAQKIGISDGCQSHYVFFNEQLENRLKDMGMIVPETYDENAAAHYQYLKEISDSTLILTIVPTYRCNFRCPYCYQDHENGWVMREDTQDAIIRFVKKNISNYTSVEISWFGGEPLLCADMIVKINGAIRQICKARYKTFQSTITTNGYLLTKELFEQLLDCGIRRYFITLDGLEAEHDRQRYLVNRSGTFQTTLNNLLSIKTVPRHRYFTVHIRSNISKANLDALDDYLAYMHERFADDSRFAFFFRQVYDWGGDTIDGFRQQLLQKEADQMIFAKLLQSKVKLNYLEFFSDLTGSVVCYASKLNSFVINPDGSLNKCTCSELRKNNLVGQLLPTGEMELNESLLGRWSTQYQEAEACDQCFLQGLCLKSSCVAPSVMDDQPGCNCFLARDNCKNLLLLLDKCSDDYPYIIDLTKSEKR